MLEPGITHSITHRVDGASTAAAMRSGELEVFATPAMIAMMEECAAKSVAPCLEEGQTTVGSFIRAEHLRPTPVGMSVTASSTLTAIEGRRLTFEITACDERGEIGRATHTRVIVDSLRFMQKCRA